MKRKIQNLTIKALFNFILLSALLISYQNLNAQCTTKITDLDKDGKDYVCAQSTTTYQAVRDAGSLGSTLSWALNSGGTIISNTDNGITAAVTIKWDSLPGTGPYCLTLTETNTGCSGADKLIVYQEKKNLVMACNDLVLIALDNYCRDTVYADELLEAPLYPNDSYTVTIFGTNGIPRVQPIVNMNDLGDTLMVLVKHTCSGLACMSNIAMQDHLATMLSCRQDTIRIQCHESELPENIHVGFPLVAGSVVTKLDEGIYNAKIPGDCGGQFKLVYTDIVDKKSCDYDFQYVINRTWTAIDASGNAWSCSEKIAKYWANMDTMQMPCNFDGLNGRKYFQCYDPTQHGGKSIYWPYRDSIPGPAITGYPEFATCSNIQFMYEDVISPGCGYNKKVIREWIVLDWCTGKSKVCDQVLSFVDDQPPVFYLPTDTLKYNADPKNCFGDLCPLPIPTVAFECSAWTYEVLGFTYKGDGNCDPVNARKENVYKNANGDWCIRNIPVDSTVCVLYKVTDECGRFSLGNVRAVVKDKMPPTAACDSHTVVTLGDGGKLYATSLDDVSWDNCGIKKMQIKRTTNRCGDSNDLYFRDYVNVCCEDVGKELMVILRVTDNSGNYNECMGAVTVVDAEKPVLTNCPANFTVNCDQNYTNIFTGGKPTATDNCGNVILTFKDAPVLNECGIGTVTRTWTIKDNSGNETVQKCVQKITVIDSKPLTPADIKWPKDITVNGCYPNVNIDESVTGIPEINNTSCKKLGIAHTDELVQNPANNQYCVQILRTFKVGDWCNPQMPFIQHTQIISINDGGAPTFTYCPSDTTVLTGEACTANVKITALATDDCTKPQDLKYTFKVDKGNNGTFELNGNGNTVNTTFERGMNKIVFTVTDGCGNQNNCTRLIRVKDSKPPTPVCIHKLTTTLGSMGMVTLKAREFNRASTDNCTPSNLGPCGCGTELKFSFSTNKNDTVRVFNCDSLKNGVGQIFHLDVWVWDLDDNKDYCTVELSLTDSKNVCPDKPNALVFVKGKISDETGTGMPGFVINGKDLISGNDFNASTNQDGNYDLDNLNPYNQYKITADKDDNPLDGLTTLDLVLIQKHILEIKKFDSPLKYLAADANNSNSVTAADLLELRKLILGINSELESKQAWKIFTTKTEFDNPNQPWNYDADYKTDSLFIGMDSLDFIAVKVGDLNRSASAYHATSGLEFRNSPNSYFVADNSQFNSGETLEVGIKNSDNSIITGFQFTLEYDSEKLQFAGIESKAIKILNSNFNVIDSRDGFITFSWNDANGVELKSGTDLFAIKLNATSSGTLSEALDINSKITKSELYDENLSNYNLKLEFSDDTKNKMEVYQNIPNPFSDRTEIIFDLPEDDEISFKVFNSTGKEIISTSGHYSKGQNTITISKSQLQQAGIYLYEITNSTSTILKKMVLIK